MSSPRSRREFLTASALTGLALPAAAHASIDTPKPAPPAMVPAAAPAAPPVIRKRKLGKTGLEVSEVGFGCMITSDQSVIERAADLGVNLLRHGARLPGRQQRAAWSARRSRAPATRSSSPPRPAPARRRTPSRTSTRA